MNAQPPRCSTLEGRSRVPVVVNRGALRTHEAGRPQPLAPYDRDAGEVMAGGDTLEPKRRRSAAGRTYACFFGDAPRGCRRTRVGALRCFGIEGFPHGCDLALHTRRCLCARPFEAGALCREQGLARRDRSDLLLRGARTARGDEDGHDGSGSSYQARRIAARSERAGQDRCEEQAATEDGLRRNDLHGRGPFLVFIEKRNRQPDETGHIRCAVGARKPGPSSTVRCQRLRKFSHPRMAVSDSAMGHGQAMSVTSPALAVVEFQPWAPRRPDNAAPSTVPRLPIHPERNHGPTWTGSRRRRSQARRSTLEMFLLTPTGERGRSLRGVDARRVDEPLERLAEAG